MGNTNICGNNANVYQPKTTHQSATNQEIIRNPPTNESPETNQNQNEVLKQSDIRVNISQQPIQVIQPPLTNSMNSPQQETFSETPASNQNDRGTRQIYPEQQHPTTPQTTMLINVNHQQLETVPNQTPPEQIATAQNVQEGGLQITNKGPSSHSDRVSSSGLQFLMDQERSSNSEDLRVLFHTSSIGIPSKSKESNNKTKVGGTL